MRFIVDAQLPSGLCPWLKERGCQAFYGPDTLGGGEADDVIARYAAEQQLIVVTKDRDFLALQARYGHKLLWLRCGNMLNAHLYDWLEQKWPVVIASLEAGERLVVAH